MYRSSLAFAASFAIGVAVSSAHSLGMVAAVAMPALAMCQRKRPPAYLSAMFYYAGALWPLIPGARNFFGPSVSLIAALTFWSVACALLASPWPLVWSASRRQAWWRTPLGLAIGVVPPLGIIGWASPLTAAGLLFPGTGWWGLAACALVPGLLAAKPRYVIPGLAAGAVFCNARIVPVRQPADWVAINTHFGAIAHVQTNPTIEFAAAQSIQHAALGTDAKVIIFPETVVPTWTAATEEFWRPTLDRLQASGKTVVIGARLPISRERSLPIITDDFGAAVALLHGSPTATGGRLRDPFSAFAYDNAVVIRGAERAVLIQRIPVPIAMWKPFQQGGARLHLLASGVIAIQNQRAAVLVCYEQLLVWPVIASLWERPNVVVAVANDYWAAGTPVPKFQRLAAGAWSRLFGLPIVSATNF
jgi:hypothetical protein